MYCIHTRPKKWVVKIFPPKLCMLRVAKNQKSNFYQLLLTGEKKCYNKYVFFIVQCLSSLKNLESNFPQTPLFPSNKVAKRC